MNDYTRLLLIFIFFIFILNLNNMVVTAEDGDPYTIFGTVRNDKGSLIADAIITVTNENTNEKSNIGNDTITGEPILIKTDSNGKYTFDLLNLKSGYNALDKIKVVAKKNGETKSDSIIVEEGTWGSRIDLNLGNVKVNSKEHFFDNMSNILLLIIIILLAIIIAYLLYKRTPAKSKQPSIREEGKLPPPPQRIAHKSKPSNERKVEKTSINNPKKGETNPSDDEISEDELPAPDEVVDAGNIGLLNILALMISIIGIYSLVIYLVEI